MSIVVRPATPDELPNLSELCQRSKAVWGYDQVFLQACWREMTILPEELRSTLIAVADDQDGVAGVVQLKVVDTEGDLLKLFIEPSKLRSGIGSLLFDWAIEQATNMGATRLFIEADPGAAQFYRDMGAYDVGFAPSGSIPGRLLPKLAFNLARDRV
jgi:N-acetylglutamate synthase-like GNAT family acetyltransferase